jgi:hypothetical protein
MRYTSFIYVLLFLCIPAAPAGAGGGASIGVAAAWGEKASQAYDLYLRYTFAPWYESENILVHPLAETGISLWNHKDETIVGANAGVGLEICFCGQEDMRPFIAGTFGPAILSGHRFNGLDLGCSGQFRSRGSLGVSFGKNFRHMLKCDITHYSNAGIGGKNDGYNTVGLSYGFAF